MMSDQEQLILYGVLRGETYICCIEGHAYFLDRGLPPTPCLNWKAAINWCESLGDEYELPSKEVLNACYENDSIRKEFTEGWYWSSTTAKCNYSWVQYFYFGDKGTDSQLLTACVRSVRKIKI